MIRVLVADDHPVVRKGLRNVFKATPDIVVAGEASDAHEVLEKVSGERYDVLLLDISMPGMDGLELLKKLRKSIPELPVLFLSMYPEELHGARAIRDGAAGYIMKESAPEELVSAIRRVSSGSRHISPSLADTLARDTDKQDGRPAHETLSDREYQVLRMIASGKTVKDIASELSLSPKTVHVYRSRILQKMHLKNTLELTHYAIKNRLIG